jgi:uncharacterized membrane protein YedE/YeeE
MNALVTQWVDLHGAQTVLVVGGLLLGLLFGVAAQQSKFCARASIIDAYEHRLSDRSAVWLFAFALSLLCVQLAVYTGWLVPAKSRFIDQPGSLSGALIGGMLFGVGMILTRGCAGRLIVLTGSGNLRAAISGLVFAVTVQAAIGGWLSPVRSAIASWWRIDAGPSRDLLHVTGLGPTGGLLLSALLMAAVVWFCIPKLKGQTLSLLMAGLVGLSVAGGWFWTQLVANNAFDPVSLQSLTFASPSADWLMRILSKTGVQDMSFEAALLPATFLGAALSALVRREFKFETFKSENKMGHYMLGAVLMGLGAVLAGGCTVGAAMSGGSVFALTAWLTLLSIIGGSWLMLKLQSRFTVLI